MSSFVKDKCQQEGVENTSKTQYVLLASPKFTGCFWLTS